MAKEQALAVTIELQAPLLITRQQVGFVWESESYIPGGVLRGAVAEVAACTVVQEERENFLKELFDRPDAPRFGHAYAGLTQPVGVLPFTAQTCKHAPGFRRDAKDDERHGIFDTLLQQVFGNQSEWTCPLCAADNGKTVPADPQPYVVIGHERPDWRFIIPSPIYRRLGRTAVGRERGAVAERMLYTLEAMSTQMLRDEFDQEGNPLRSTTQFHALVRLGEEDDVQGWKDRLERVVYLGGARSRGLGQVSVKAEPVSLISLSPRDLALAPEALAEGQAQSVEKPSYGMNMAERIQAFTQAVYKITGDEVPEYWYFTADLQSDLIPGDVHGPRWQLGASDFGFPDAVERVWSFARYTRAGGWSSAWGLPKPLAPALEAGSVFVFRVPTGDQALAEEVLQRCAALEYKSMGQRREEGFGAIQICAPFHFEMEVRK